MVTLNLATEADLTNGSRRVIEDIILDPMEYSNESDVNKTGIIHLHYPPTMLVFQPFQYEYEPFPGFNPVDRVQDVLLTVSALELPTNVLKSG